MLSLGWACSWRLGLLAGVAWVAQLAWLDVEVRTQFEGHQWAVPARIYARPLELYVGKQLSADDFEQELLLADYHRQRSVSRPGTFSRTKRRFSVKTRAFQFPDGQGTQQYLDVRFNPHGLVESMGDSQGRAVPIARFDPAQIARIYPLHREDREPVVLRDVPKTLVGALLVVEDRAFFEAFRSFH